ncbi:hypothetical protein [Spirillospora sp. CA-128828]|uniref:hypothetical protein n=1 Tax=Spirillospora sp. CA-128828 TaxID=3240033 RepID=UPI003D8DE5DE
MTITNIETVEPLEVPQDLREEILAFESIRTSRFFYRTKGLNILTASAPGSTPETRVTASVTEVDPVFRPMIGSARMSVHNIVPQGGDIAVLVNVESSQLVTVALTLVYVNP